MGSLATQRDGEKRESTKRQMAKEGGFHFLYYWPTVASVILIIIASRAIRHLYLIAVISPVSVIKHFHLDPCFCSSGSQQHC